MNPKLILNIAFTVIFSVTSYAQSSVEYLESITKEFETIAADNWDYTRAVAHGKSARKVENRRREVLKSTLEAKQRVSRMKPYSGDASLRDSVVSYLNLSYNILNHDYAKIMDMEEVAEQSYDLMEAYMLAQKIANEKMNKASLMIDDEQRKFAAKNNIKLIEGTTKTSEKLSKAAKVYDYYNGVYLIFFKPFKQDIYLVEAQNKNDMNAMKQNIESLSKISDEGLKRLDTLKAFGGDASLKQSCSEVLKFYKTASANKYPKVLDFYLQKEKFEKIKAAFDAKPQNKRTQQDVDEFNKAVKEYNAASNEYNAVNNELNNTRAALVDKWNKSASGFTDKHVPKGK